MTALHARLNEELQELRLAVEETDVYFWLSLASAMDTSDHQEACTLSGIRLLEKNDGDWQIEVTWNSSIWDEKKHFYRYHNNQVEHWIEIKGKGTLSEVTYLSGTVDDSERGSIPGFGAVYVGCPNFIDKPLSHPSEFTAISAGNVTELWGSALNGGPLLFAFGEFKQQGWLAAGLHVQPGEYGFQSMSWNRKRSNALAEPDNIIGPAAISLDYPGGAKVDGTWTSPRLVFFVAESEEACLHVYCEQLYRSGLVAATGAGAHDWWADPIFCTWHEQVARGQQDLAGGVRGMGQQEGGVKYTALCTQANVEHWLQILHEHGIRPGTIILDANWQKDLGFNLVDTAKFPDLRGFIDQRHSENQHVVLWMAAWNTEGIPPEWCVLRDGEPVAADPTCPAYRDHVEEMMFRMLGNGTGCYNGDGLKIDATYLTPEGPGLQSHQDVYGFELLHAYLKLIYDSAKSAKADALVSIYSANPYFADCCDMVRVGDLYTFRGDPRHTLHWRAQVIGAALPHALIDTDGCFRFSMRDDVEELLEHQVAAGVPCLYQAENLVQMRAFCPNRTRKLTAREYDAISRSWAAYDRNR
jgi:hypothetical protein